MTTTRTNRKYTKEFKEEAVKLVLEQGYSIKEAAESLGVTTKLLYLWKKQFVEKKTIIITDDELSELKKLRKENKQLKMEKEILKKAATFFAKEIN